MVELDFQKALVPRWYGKCRLHGLPKLTLHCSKAFAIGLKDILSIVKVYTLFNLVPRVLSYEE